VNAADLSVGDRVEGVGTVAAFVASTACTITVRYEPFAEYVALNNVTSRTVRHRRTTTVQTAAMTALRKRASDTAWQFAATSAVAIFETHARYRPIGLTASQRRRVNRRSVTATVGNR
jgi:hypothetical protein